MNVSVFGLDEFRSEASHHRFFDLGRPLHAGLGWEAPETWELAVGGAQAVVWLDLSAWPGPSAARRDRMEAWWLSLLAGALSSSAAQTLWVPNGLGPLAEAALASVRKLRRYASPDILVENGLLPVNWKKPLPPTQPKAPQFSKRSLPEVPAWFGLSKQAWTASQAAQAYFAWLARAGRGILSVEQSVDGVRIGLLGLALLILRSIPNTRQQGLQSYWVAGGWLARGQAPQSGRFDVLLSSSSGQLGFGLWNFQPRLPRWLYAWTQSALHRFSQHSFFRSLAEEGTSPSTSQAA